MLLAILARQPEVRALATLLVSLLILPLSAYSILLPTFIWTAVKATYFIYFIGVFFLVRRIAQGGTYTSIPNRLDGKTYLITGSAGGIGKETAIEMAKRGARVVLFARPTNLAQTIKDVQKQAADPQEVVGYALDLSDLRSIKKCADEFLRSESESRTITALINNAGVMACPYSKTKDDFEMQMGTNHFGHFYLTQLLLPRLLKSKSRIVNVSSVGHALWQVPCDEAHYNQLLDPKKYKPWHAYSLSKSANILFARELQNRYGNQGIRAYSLHPGAVITDLNRHVEMNMSKILTPILTGIKNLLFKASKQGAQTNLFCAISDEARPGEFHSDCQATPVGNAYAKDDEKAKEWWDFSEKTIAEKVKQFE